MSGRRDNYAIQVEQAKKRFLTYDQSQMIRKLGLASDETYLYLPFLGLEYRIHRSSAAVEKRAGDGPYEDGNSFNEVLTLFDVLCDSKDGATLAGTWVSLSALGGGVHDSGAVGGIFETAVRRLAPCEEGLAAALERLGGVRLPQGEPGYCVPVFPFLPLYFQYWRADEEFPAQVRLLWDANTTDFIHYETAYYLANVFFDRLLQLMGPD